MDFRHSARSMALQEQVQIFLDEHIYPAETEFEHQVEANRAVGQPFRTPAVLGGLIQDKLTTTDRGIPILKDIPLIGYAFKFTERIIERRSCYC